MRWTKTALARRRPYPGEAWTVTSDPRKTAKALAKAVGVVPAEPELETEIARGIAARIRHRYNLEGNHPRDSIGSMLVDEWCARRGVAFALEVLLGVVRSPPINLRVNEPRGFGVRWDGQPWGRLREHLFTTDADSFAEAKGIAAKARTKPQDELPFALSYCFCDPAWVAKDLEKALDRGRGPLCVIAAIADPGLAEQVVRRMMEPQYRRFELIEEFPQHMPNVMSRLGDAGAGLVIDAARQAWNRASRKPWLDLVACYDGPEAEAFLSEFG